MTSLAEIASIAAGQGLALRGAFHPSTADGAPLQALTMVLLGNVGGSLWPTFSASAEHGDGRPDALDRWTRRIVDDLSARFAATALYPFGGPPHWPFQRWAQRAEAVHPSPLGLLIHPDHGLWHAYRAALAFPERLALKPADRRPSPCAACPSRPCLTACPVSAFDGTRYDVATCAGHIAVSAGAACMSAGCRARRACPVGTPEAYGPAQQAFHMAAFLKARH